MTALQCAETMSAKLLQKTLSPVLMTAPHPAVMIYARQGRTLACALQIAVFVMVVVVLACHSSALTTRAAAL
jgi:hypothetical protein